MTRRRFIRGRRRGLALLAVGVAWGAVLWWGLGELHHP
jgi:hypothetical protein